MGKLMESQKSKGKWLKICAFCSVFPTKQRNPTVRTIVNKTEVNGSCDIFPNLVLMFSTVFFSKLQLGSTNTRLIAKGTKKFVNKKTIWFCVEIVQVHYPEVSDFFQRSR
ncbi:hypothetical protein AALC17_10815 [Oscillospiraceae bacterium 38-13]